MMTVDEAFDRAMGVFEEYVEYLLETKSGEYFVNTSGYYPEKVKVENKEVDSKALGVSSLIGVGKDDNYCAFVPAVPPENHPDLVDDMPFYALVMFRYIDQDYYLSIRVWGDLIELTDIQKVN